MFIERVAIINCPIIDYYICAILDGAFHVIGDIGIGFKSRNSKPMVLDRIYCSCIGAFLCPIIHNLECNVGTSRADQLKQAIERMHGGLRDARAICTRPRDVRR